VKPILKIGIFIASDPGCGGIYQYDHNLLNILKRYDKENNYVVFVLCKDIELQGYRGVRWETIYLDNNITGLIHKLLNELYSKFLTIKDSLLKKRSKNHIIHSPEDVSTKVSGLHGWLNDVLIYRQFRKKQIDLMIYPSQKPLKISDDIPYIVAIHDLQHLINPEFPEVSRGGEWVRRQSYFKNVTNQALAILVDSEVGKEDIINNYVVPKEKVKVLPFLPQKYLFEGVSANKRKITKKKYKLEEEYFFYPAQFWPHKNHIRLIKAISLIKKKWSVNIPLVLTGNKNVSHSTFKEVMSLAKELSVIAQVNYLGYVDSEDMGSLYSMAIALVMPTFFGPTNIPVVEAFLLGCPVITSNIRGIREQVGKAGLLVDPTSIDDIAEAIHRIYTNQALRRSLRGRGLKKAKQWNEEKFAEKLISIIQYCHNKVKE
jgi:glycosyltransferase involved in cell wall biosynthesis